MYPVARDDATWLAASPLPAATFEALHRRVIFDCCKWDFQAEDVSVLAPFPLVLRHDVWRSLAACAEALAAESAAAERELLERPELHGRLGLPGAVVRTLRSSEPASVSGPRTTRFDFHLTTDGWRISEANADVPGGFIEASGFTELMAEHYALYVPAGDPAAALALAIASRADPGATVALVHATGYADDAQVMAFLARRLVPLGLRPVAVAPDHLSWDAGHVRFNACWTRGAVSQILRFFPAEWLPNLPRACGWRAFFRGGLTPLSNPATALLTQSKRFPLVWDDLRTPLRTWRALLPETRDPREVPAGQDEAWVLKPALGRIGEGVAIAGLTAAAEFRFIRRTARWRPRQWVAQRRFDAVPLATTQGGVYPCIGVFVIDGRAAGAYGRIASAPLIDSRARDIAVLVSPRDLAGGAPGAAGTSPVRASATPTLQRHPASVPAGRFYEGPRA